MAEVEPVAIGPSWQRDENGDWLLPDLTLGWDVLVWSGEYLRYPDGPQAGEPWRYTPEQARFVLWWYAVDEQGRFVYRDAMLRRVKGWGKDPVGASICATEFVGPCRFGGFDSQGKPVAVPHSAAWVVIAAVAQSQTRTTMALFQSLFSDDALAEYSIDLGKEIIYAHKGKARIEAVTSSPRAMEGVRATFTLANETQHWLANNDGHEMAEVIRRNAVKARDGAARRLALSNAHEPGEDSEAERDWETWQAIEQGKTRAKRFLYDSLEAPPGVDLANEEELRAALRAARGDSVWLNEDGHVDEIYDPRNSPSTSRRFYLNQLVAAEDAWIAPHEWDQLADEGVTVEDGEQITLGLDPSKTDDHTVLMGCRVEDGFVFTIEVWDPEEHAGEVPRDLVDGQVRHVHEKYDVIGFFSDLHPFEAYIDKWAEDFGRSYKVKSTGKHPIAWDMRGKQKESTVEIERLHGEIVEGAFKHDGDKRVRQHFHNGRRRPNAWGVTVRKEHRESSRKIDAIPSVMLARTARRLYLTSGKRKRKRSGRSVFT